MKVFLVYKVLGVNGEPYPGLVFSHDDSRPKFDKYSDRQIIELTEADLKQQEASGAGLLTWAKIRYPYAVQDS